MKIIQVKEMKGSSKTYLDLTLLESVELVRLFLLVKFVSKAERYAGQNNQTFNVSQ